MIILYISLMVLVPAYAVNLLQNVINLISDQDYFTTIVEAYFASLTVLVINDFMIPNLIWFF